MRRCWTTTMAENPKDELIVGEVILHFSDAPILGNLISQPLLPTRLTFECQTDLWRGSNFAHHRFVMIDQLLPKIPGPCESRCRQVEWRAHSAWFCSLQTDRQDRPKLLSKSTARECVDQKELHEIARLQEALDIESATSELDGEHFEGEIMSHATQGKFGQHHYLSCFAHAGLGFRV